MTQNRLIQAVIIMLGLGAALALEGLAQEPWQTIRIEVDEYRFVPNQITLTKDRPVRIEIRNIGNEEHEFRSRIFQGPLIEVGGEGISVKSTDIHSIIVESRKTVTIKWLSPQPGTYDFECRIPSHHGMDGTIIVEAEK